MSVEVGLSGYFEPKDLMGVITVLWMEDIGDEEKVSILQAWCERVGRRFEDWMGKLVVGSPIGVADEGRGEEFIG